MKKFMSMLLMAAVVVTSTVVPNLSNVETVTAASVTYSLSGLLVNGQKYDNYEDFVEAYCVAMEYKKVDLDTYSESSYLNENKEKVYYTYRQWNVENGSAIPDDCVAALCHGSLAWVAYKADGTKVIIYNKEGYDAVGYDREGYDRTGCLKITENLSVTCSPSELSVNDQKYDCYEDFVEAYCVALEYKKVDLDSYSKHSYLNENKEKVYYTYRQWITEKKDIPDDCVAALFRNGDADIAYKADGTKVIICNKDGYDDWGYDREGYNREGYNSKGYDREGYNKNGYNREGHLKQGKTVSIERIRFSSYSKVGHPYELLWQKNKKKQLNVTRVRTKDGKWIAAKHYKVTKTPLHVDKYGHGIYKVKVQTDSCYNNASFEKKVTVVPNNDVGLGAISDTKRLVTYFVPYKKDDRYRRGYKEAKKEEGIKYIQIKYGKLKKSKRTKNGKAYYVFKEGDYTKDCVQKTVDLSKQKLTNFSNGYWSAKGYFLVSGDEKKQDETYEMKYRYYVIANGKKIYSDWDLICFPPNGIQYELKGF